MYQLCPACFEKSTLIVLPLACDHRDHRAINESVRASLLVGFICNDVRADHVFLDRSQASACDPARHMQRAGELCRM